MFVKKENKKPIIKHQETRINISNSKDEEEKVVMESKNNLSIDNLNKGSQKIEFWILTFK